MMAMELECGSCSRRIHVEAAEGIVVCPHCECALQIPAPAELRPSDNGSEVAMPVVMAAESATDVDAESVSQFAFLDTTDHAGATVPDSSVFPGFPIGEDGPPSGAVVADEPPPGAEAIDCGLRSADCGMEESAIRPCSNATAAKSAIGAPAARVADDAVTIAAAGFPPRRGVPGFLFVMLAGYASAVTIALLWLWWTRGRVHPLESLPDLKPERHAYVIEESAPLPPGHTLRLGDTRRFGNLEVTPLRVTRGPAMLVSITDGDEDDSNAEPAMPVLKLWLRIRNVSGSQTFRPFGRELLRLPANSRNDRFNTFVCREDQKRRDGQRVLVYYLNREDRDLALQEQHADRELAPRESFETYIATAERGIDELKGDLVWRVHFRKGLNPKSSRGVTTLIEVAFHSDAVQEESPAGSGGVE
jgi:hypothetical protein